MKASVPSEHSYALYDKLVVVGVGVVVLLCTWLLPMPLFLNAVLGAVAGVGLYFAYSIVRPSDEAIELYGLMADTAEKADRLSSGKLRETVVTIAITIYTEGVLKYKQEVRHLNELVTSAYKGVSTTQVMPVLEQLRSRVEIDQRRQFEQAQQRVEFLDKLYGATGKTSEAVKLLQKILESEK